MAEISGPMVHQRQLHNHRSVHSTLVMSHHHMDCHGGLEIHHTANLNISKCILYIYTLSIIFNKRTYTIK